jgi:hypothetical protein
VLEAARDADQLVGRVDSISFGTFRPRLARAESNIFDIATISPMLVSSVDVATWCTGVLRLVLPEPSPANGNQGGTRFGATSEVN